MAEQSEELKATIASINAGDEVDLTYGETRMQFTMERVDEDGDLEPEGGWPGCVFRHGITAVHSIKRPEMPEPNTYERAIDSGGDAWTRGGDGLWLFVDGPTYRRPWSLLVKDLGPMRPFSRDLIGVPLEQGV